MKTASPQGPFSVCPGAFDDIPWSSSAGGVRHLGQLLDHDAIESGQLLNGP